MFTQSYDRSRLHQKNTNNVDQRLSLGDKSGHQISPSLPQSQTNKKRNKKKQKAKKKTGQAAEQKRQKLYTVVDPMCTTQSPSHLLTDTGFKIQRKLHRKFQTQHVQITFSNQN